MNAEDFYIRKDAMEMAIRIYPHVSSHEFVLKGAKAIEAYLRGSDVVALPEEATGD